MIKNSALSQTLSYSHIIATRYSNYKQLSRQVSSLAAVVYEYAIYEITEEHLVMSIGLLYLASKCY